MVAPQGARLRAPQDTCGHLLTCCDAAFTGVMIEHRGVVNLMQHTQATCGFSPQDMFLQQSSISFDMTLAEIWLPLSVGASILPAEARAQQDGPRLLRQISRHPVTVVCPVPSELFMWLESGLTQNRASHVRWLMTGAEALSPALLARTQAALPGIRTLNMYGPTEVGFLAFSCARFCLLS